MKMCTSLRHSLSMVLFYDVQWLWFYITEILVKVVVLYNCCNKVSAAKRQDIQISLNMVSLLKQNLFIQQLSHILV
jgi:hypothetical protein